MSHHVELERILQAWFNWESCSPAEKNQYRDAFHRLLDEARAGANVCRQELTVTWADGYREFCAANDARA